MLSEVQEQPEGVTFLRKVVEGRLTSPLLLVGPEGVGRRFSVLQAAKELFSRGDPRSPACIQLDRGLHTDFTLLSPESGKEIGVDAIREVTSKAYDFPSLAKKRIIVIDGADLLTMEAANAFLKTLEEPPKRTLFFLLAESAERVIPTIRSRCGNVRYKRLSEAFIVRVLTDIEPDGTKALVYARLAEGSLGRAVQYCGSNRLELRDRVLALLKTGLGGHLSSLFLAIDALKDDLDLGIRFLDLLLYDLAMLHHDPSRMANLDRVEDLRVISKALGETRRDTLHRALHIMQDREQRYNISPVFHLKTCLGETFSE